MSYTDKEFIDAVNERLRKDEECHRQVLEAFEAKKRQWATETVRKIIAEQGLIVTDEEFQQCVQEALRIMDEHPHRGTIVVNEIQLGGAS